MIAVVASRFDAAAREMVGRWPGGGACLLTADDLTVAGWRWSDDPRVEDSAVVSGHRVRIGTIRGVLTRRPIVLPQELTTVVETDRSYIAAEITAFLTAWLSRLSCPVLNRPQGGCLSGPNWTIEQWLRTAVHVGIPVRNCRRTIPAPASSAAQETRGDRLDRVVLVGSKIVGEVGTARAEDARRLADAAGVDLLEAQFCGQELVAATCWPDLAASSTLAAVACYFAESST